MIEIKNCSKAFGKIQAVNKVTMDIGEREVFGLIGSNGAGKSTLLRIMAGIIRQDRGEVLMDEEPVFENERIKEHFFYIPDDAYIRQITMLWTWQNFTVVFIRDFSRHVLRQ